MKILIIGGTKFVGRALVNELLKRDHSITLFHRGQTNPDLFPDMSRVFGDRETDLDKLGEEEWDVVIDTCGYYPRVVSLSVNYLKERTGLYVFVSSISAYASTTELGMEESAPLQQLNDPSTEDMSSEDNAYGGLKVLCEEEVANGFGKDRSLIIGPGLIVGPHDPTNRFTYWTIRIRRGGDIIAPGDGSFKVQFIDVRDLASFMIDLIERNETGYFNVTGPEEPMTLGQFLSHLLEFFDTSALLHWVDNQWLLDHEISPWMEMPLWLTSEGGAAMMQVSIAKAREKGLQFRPLDETIADTIDWYDQIRGDDEDWPAGLKPPKEHDLLDELLES